MLLGDEAGDLSVRQNAGRVVNTVGDKQWQPNGDDHAIGFRSDLLQHVPRRLPDVRCQEHVFAAITGNAQLGQTQHVHLLLASRADGFKDSLSIPVPVQWRLVKNPRAQSNSLHVIFR